MTKAARIFSGSSSLTGTSTAFCRRRRVRRGRSFSRPSSISIRWPAGGTGRSAVQACLVRSDQPSPGRGGGAERGSRRILSTGMATEEEIAMAVSLFRGSGGGGAGPDALRVALPDGGATRPTWPGYRLWSGGSGSRWAFPIIPGRPLRRCSRRRWAPGFLKSILLLTDFMIVLIKIYPARPRNSPG